MSAMGGRSLIGTSGWSYEHWKGLFYPPELRGGELLRFYTGRFSTVEVNNTFYHLPAPKAFEEWEKTAPRGFIYALKCSRFITHMKKLSGVEGSLDLFLDRAALLGEHLGPILFQLPPRWRSNPSRLRDFIGLLPGGQRFVFEFRDSTWFNEEVYRILRDREIALCIYHMPGFQTPIEVTAPFAYIRFHGTSTLYGGRYSKGELAEWARRIKDFVDGGMDVYAYFNNDALGNAVINAGELMAMVT